MTQTPKTRKKHLRNPGSTDVSTQRSAPAKASLSATEKNAINVATTSHEKGLDRWEKFWFAPKAYNLLRAPRIGFGILSLVYLFSFIFEVNLWFSATGLMASERLGELVVANEAADAAIWRWSFLHLIQSGWQLYLFFSVVGFCGLAVIIGWGGRWAAAGLWLGIVSIANANWVLAEVGLIPLCLGLASVVITGIGVKQSGDAKPRLDSIYCLGIRLNQVHVIGFLLAYSLSSILNENPVGEAMSRQLLVLGFEWIPSSPIICKVLHSLLIAIPIIFIPLLILVPARRNWVLIGIFIYLGAVGWISGDILFASSLAVMSMVFRYPEPARQIDMAP